MLTKKEQKETLDVTIGRIRGLATNLQSSRLRDLIDKVIEDLDKERFPEAYHDDYSEDLEELAEYAGISLSTELNPSN